MYSSGMKAKVHSDRIYECQGTLRWNNYSWSKSTVVLVHLSCFLSNYHRAGCWLSAEIRGDCMHSSILLVTLGFFGALSSLKITRVTWWQCFSFSSVLCISRVKEISSVTSLSIWNMATTIPVQVFKILVATLLETKEISPDYSLGLLTWQVCVDLNTLTSETLPLEKHACAIWLMSDCLFSCHHPQALFGLMQHEDTSSLSSC